MSAESAYIYAGLCAGKPEAVTAIKKHMNAARGSVTGAARTLEIHVSTLHRWLLMPSLANIPRLGRTHAAAGATAARKAAAKSRRRALRNDAGATP